MSFKNFKRSGKFKAEQWVIQFYFNKIPLHQQEFLAVSVFFCLVGTLGLLGKQG